MFESRLAREKRQDDCGNRNSVAAENQFHHAIGDVDGRDASLLQVRRKLRIDKYVDLNDTDAEYQRLFEQHEKYDSELQRILKEPYLSSEDLLEEIKLKKMKLHCKDEMERIASRIQRARGQYS